LVANALGTLESEMVSGQLPNGLPEGAHTLHAVVNSTNNVAEFDKSNNDAQLTIQSTVGLVPPAPATNTPTPTATATSTSTSTQPTPTSTVGPPANDNFANAAPLGIPDTARGTTRLATIQEGEPIHAGDATCFLIPG